VSSNAVWPLKGNSPAIIVYNTTPSAQMSLRRSSASPFSNFWREIRKCSGDLSRYTRIRTRQVFVICRSANGQAEIQYLCTTVRAHHDVGAFQIAVNNSVAMSMSQCVSNLNSKAHGLLEAARFDGDQ
jgi:hypothetical protein